MTKHVHAELIKAWADGAVIQWRRSGVEWMDIPDNNPSWGPTVAYRIKPASMSPLILTDGECAQLWRDNLKTGNIDTARCIAEAVIKLALQRGVLYTPAQVAAVIAAAYENSSPECTLSAVDWSAVLARAL